MAKKTENQQAPEQGAPPAKTVRPKGPGGVTAPKLREMLSEFDTAQKGAKKGIVNQPEGWTDHRQAFVVKNIETIREFVASQPAAA